ncbi:MAG: hypothetical protein HYX69_03470 [Planctomycetia bacterium]|nr:hypothetical protein [Planctomycetia bacterium]
MNKLTTTARAALALATLALLLAIPGDVSARGGGHFGGGGFGGGGRNFGGGGRDFGGGGRDFGGGARDFGGGARDFGGGNFARPGAVDRSPSMSRGAFDRPGGVGAFRPEAGFDRAGGFDRGGFGDRPTPGDLGRFLNLPQDAGGRGAAGIGDRGAGNLQNRAADRTPGQNLAGAGDRAGNLQNRAANRTPGQFADNHPNWQNHAQNVRNNLNDNRHNWFNNNWWHNHPNAWPNRWNYWHGHYPGYWWGAAGWGALTGFIAGSWAQPVYYNYADGGNVAYDDGNVYVDGQQVATADQYAQQAQTLAATPTPADVENADWMPLGVFSLSTSANDDHPVMVLQMAVNKQGNITGMYYNTASDNAQPIQGAVDRATQRAAWTVGDKKSTVLETGIYNLTKDETPVLVHFGGQQTQTWLMVRMKEPKEGEEGLGPTDAPKPSGTLDK